MLCNDPGKFRDEMLKGYAAAYPDYVTVIPGGIARSTKAPVGKVMVMNGGGSGHYPAFCGIIGDGFMDATVVGNVFTSPPVDDVLNVAHAIDQGTGIYIVGGNYTGDKMNFNMARDILKDEGIDSRTFYITDDIASASPEEWEKRRGNVGTFMVFKAAGAAASLGKPMDEVERLTAHANDRVRTMSVGFRGCTLPGESAPHFVVPKGKMELGQGIHGEPGIAEDDVRSADELAQMLVECVLAEAPSDDSKRIGTILDGLGSTKYEELFVMWGKVRELLENRGYMLVKPLVGEYVTSLDMEGVALSIEFLDEELEELWLAPCDTASFRLGDVNTAARKHQDYMVQLHEKKTFAKGTPAADAAADFVVGAFERMAQAIDEVEETLAQIDGISGDGDHGRGMVNGTSAALKAAKATRAVGAAVGSVLKEAGDAWAAKAGGTSGVLWGAALAAAGESVGDDKKTITASDVVQAIRAACAKMMELGGAKRGDRTMLDVLIPFSESFSACASEGQDTCSAWAKSAEVAADEAQKTAQLVPKVGRARPAGRRALGTPDAGAVSMAICIKAVLEE